MKRSEDDVETGGKRKKNFQKGEKKWGRTGTKVNRQSRKEGENSVEKSIPETKAETIATRLQFHRRRRFH